VQSRNEPIRKQHLSEQPRQGGFRPGTAPQQQLTFNSQSLMQVPNRRPISPATSKLYKTQFGTQQKTRSSKKQAGRAYSPAQPVFQPTTSYNVPMHAPPFLSAFNTGGHHPALMINGSIFHGSGTAPGTFAHHFMQPGHLGARGVSPYSGTRPIATRTKK